MKKQVLWLSIIVGVILPFSVTKGDPYQLTDKIICSDSGVGMYLEKNITKDKLLAISRYAANYCLLTPETPCIANIRQTGPLSLNIKCKAALITPVLIPKKETKA